MNPTDRQWVDALYQKDASRLFKIAARRLGDPDIAQDAVHEVFLALISKLEAVKIHPNPSGWLMKALRYVILQKIELEQRRLGFESPLDEAVGVAGAPDLHVPLREMLPPGLTAREQDLLVWRYEDGLSYEEVARRLNIPILTCRTQFFRTRKKYQRLAEKEKIFSELM